MKNSLSPPTKKKDKISYGDVMGIQPKHEAGVHVWLAGMWHDSEPYGTESHIALSSSQFQPDVMRNATMRCMGPRPAGSGVWWPRWSEWCATHARISSTAEGHAWGSGVE